MLGDISLYGAFFFIVWLFCFIYLLPFNLFFQKTDSHLQNMEAATLLQLPLEPIQ